MIQNMQRVWDDPSLGDCLVWLWMVTLTPRNAEHTLYGVQRELFRWLCLMRGDVLTWEPILSILQTFFYDQGRVLAWQTIWNAVRDGMQNKFTQHDIVACSENDL
jgi:hypothetical protein